MFSNTINCCPTNDDYYESEKSSARIAHVEHTSSKQIYTEPKRVNVRIAFFGSQSCNEYFTAEIENQTTIKQLERKLRDGCKQYPIGSANMMIVALPQG